MSNYKTKNGTQLPILSLRGKDYLEVKYRIVWFREERPTWAIETELVNVTDKSCLARAIIRDDQGRIVSTSHKFENAQGFPDFIEKSETGSIGRALALIGYGTQFCADELDEGARIVDSPAERPKVENPFAAKNFQPSEDEGSQYHVNGYVIPFGKFAKKPIEQIPLDQLRGYVEWLEQNAEKKKQPLGQVQLEFIERACEYIKAAENTPIN